MWRYAADSPGGTPSAGDGAIMWRCCAAKNRWPRTMLLRAAHQSRTRWRREGPAISSVPTAPASSATSATRTILALRHAAGRGSVMECAWHGRVAVRSANVSPGGDGRSRPRLPHCSIRPAMTVAWGDGRHRRGTRAGRPRRGSPARRRCAAMAHPEAMRAPVSCIGVPDRPAQAAAAAAGDRALSGKGKHNQPFISLIGELARGLRKWSYRSYRSDQ